MTAMTTFGATFVTSDVQFVNNTNSWIFEVKELILDNKYRHYYWIVIQHTTVYFLKVYISKQNSYFYLFIDTKYSMQVLKC